MPNLTASEQRYNTNASGPLDEKGVPDGEERLAMGQHPKDIVCQTEGVNAPRPEWVRGTCPECGDFLVSNLYFVGGRGYLCVWQCWTMLKGDGRCNYQKKL